MNDFHTNQTNQMKNQEIHPATGKELIPPLWYALGSIVAVPLVALCMIMAGILIILGWPFIPILCYFERKKNVENITNQTK